MHEDLDNSRKLRRLSVIGRIIAAIFGLGLVVFGLSFAADAGEILVGTPFMFLGGLGVAAAVTGKMRRRWKR
jgi:hypothetical protein